MSAHLMARVFASALPSTKRLVMLALADFARNDTLECWPAISTVASRTGLSDRSVRRTIRELEDDGLIETTRRSGQSGVYVLHIEKLLTPDRVSLVRADRASAPTPDTLSALPRTERPSDTLSARTESPGSEEVGRTESPEGADRVSGEGGQCVRQTKNITNNKNQTPPKTSSSERGTRLSKDFAITEQMIVWAREHCPNVLARPVINNKGPGLQETEKFIDHWSNIPGAKGRKIDWVGAWRNWMRNAEERAASSPRTTNGHRPSTTDSRVQAGLDLARRYAEEDGS